MSRKNEISAKFDALKKMQQKALITYISAGDPDLPTTRELVLAMEQNGADMIELGIPYSDPVADGPVIQQASLRALKSGTTIDAIFNLVAELRQVTSIPLVCMVYVNSILQYGLRDFVEKCAEVGVDGLIVPDLPLEESEELAQVAATAGVDLIMLVAPTTPRERIVRIAQRSRGFLYCVAVVGVTGTQDKLDNGLADFMEVVRSCTALPLAVGFGISTPAQAATVAPMTDGIIVGSAVIKVIEKNLGESTLVSQVGEFVGQLKMGAAKG